MKNYEYISQLLLSQSNDKMVAEAYRDFYKKRYEQVAENVSKIGEGDSEISSILLQVYDYNLNARVFVLTTTDVIHNLIQEYEDTEEDEYPDTIDIFNKITSTHVATTIEEVTTSLSLDVTNLYIAWKGFEAIANGSNNMSQDFLNKVNLEMPERGREVIDAISYVYDSLNQSTEITDKIQSLLTFSGIDASITEGEHTPSDDIPLSSYTGANPIASWFNSLDWSSVGDAISSIAEVVGRCVKFLMYDLTKTVIGGLWKGIKSIFRTVKRGVADPIDFYCDEDYIGYFDIPAKSTYTIYYNQSPHVYDNVRKQLLLNESFNSFSVELGSVYYHISAMYDESAPEVSLKPIILLIARYVRPIDPSKLNNILSKYDLNDGVITTDNLLKCIREIQSTDLRMSSKISSSDSVGERGVLMGIFLSYQLETLYGLSYNCLYHGNLYINSTYDWDQEYANRIIDDSCADWLTAYVKNLRYLKENANNLDSGSVVLSFTPGACHGLTAIPSNVTNQTFIKWLTSWQLYTLPANPGSELPLNTQAVVDPWSKGFMSTVAMGYMRVGDTYSIPCLIPNESIRDIEIANASTLYDCSGLYAFLSFAELEYYQNTSDIWGNLNVIFVPYTRKSSAPESLTAHIKTDSDNAKAINAFLTGVVILAAAVTLTVVGFKVTKRLKMNRDRAYISMQTNFRKYEKLLRLGPNGESGAQTVYKQLCKDRRKYTILSNLLGPSMGPGTMTYAMSQTNSSIDSIQSLRKLIKS